MPYDVTALGELLIDLVPVKLEARSAYLAKPGGAPGNVAAGVARLGHSAAMVGKVGAEAFGDAVIAALESAGVATGAIVRSVDHNTPLAIVTLSERGEPDFFFYRENCADSNITVDDIPTDLIAQSRILHVGTLLWSNPTTAAAQGHAIVEAKTRGVRVSVDMNLRPALWRDEERMRNAGLEAIQAANIVKASSDELHFLAGTAGAERAVRSLWHPDLMVFAVTKGSSGAEVFTEQVAVSVPGFSIRVIDTVGCGDSFMASLLSGLLDHDFGLDGEALRTIARRSSAAGAIVATRRGALESMPDCAAVDRFLAG